MISITLAGTVNLIGNAELKPTRQCEVLGKWPIRPAEEIYNAKRFAPTFPRLSQHIAYQCDFNEKVRRTI